MPLIDLAPDVLHTIAVYVAADNLALGPPKHLPALLQTSRHFHSLLNIRANPHLYADIFKRQFDTAALARRLPRNQLTATSLAAELVRRWTVLSRIRRLSLGSGFEWAPRAYRPQEVIEDLATAYLLFTESDGKNAMILLQYAHVEQYLNFYSLHRLQPVHCQPDMPPDSIEAGFWLWLSWMVADYQKLIGNGIAPNMNWLTTPYMLGTFAYSNSFASWIVPKLPIAPLSPPNSLVRREPSPELTANASPFFIADLAVRPRPSFSLTYFGAPLRCTSPLASQAATLHYLAGLQKRPAYIHGTPPVPDDVLLAPLVQAESQGNFSSGASTLKHLDPRLADAVAGHRSFTPEYLHLQLPSLARSKSWDDDVKRLLCCVNPYALPSELGTPRYRWTKGSLTGEWDGRFMLPDLDTYRAVMTGPTAHALNRLEDATLLQDVQSWKIEEQYYVTPRAYADRYRNTWYHGASAASAPPLGHPLQAFIPRQYKFQRRQNGSGLDVWDGRVNPTENDISFFETWKGGKRGLDVDIETMDDEDEVEEDDDREATLTIQITGHSIARMAYVPESFPTMMGHGSLLWGTVRKWDGLITLTATPPGGPGGEWLWRGYIVGDGNFVGRYRESSMDVRRNAYEGVFAMRRRV